MSDIVLGYDGRDGARAALEKVAELSGALGDRVVLVFGYEVSRLGGEVADYAAALREHAEQTIQHGVHQAQSLGIEVDTVIVEDDPPAALERVARERDARMIAVGSHGEPPLKSVIIGSTPHKLLHIADRPVLVVPARR
jgi:nucleotide-binding universal stress UspA family protein